MWTARALILLQPLLSLASSDQEKSCQPGQGCFHDSLSLLQQQKYDKFKAGGVGVHFIYTVGCNNYQLVQAVVLDHTWKEVGNRGRLTRIAVGCEGEEARALLGSSPLKGDDRYSVFFSEGELMEVPGKNDRYPARSRPYAIGQWLAAAKPQESVVAILDPDFVFNQPLSSHPDLPKVRPGQMLAQKYDLGLDFVPGFEEAGEERPQLSFQEAVANYSTGPPWVLHMQDLTTMLPDWGRYTDSWPKKKGLLREQDAFCMSAFKHSVPAIGQSNFMISNPVAWNEDWSDKKSELGSWSPYVFHYCQTYTYGNWSFYKSLISDDYTFGKNDNAIPGPLNCGAPLLQEPPAPPADEPDRQKFMGAWMLWKLFPAMNKAFAAYQEQYCPAEKAQEPGGRMLVRTMHPKKCNQRTTTRYLATPGVAASWHSTGVQGDDLCGAAAQATGM